MQQTVFIVDDDQEIAEVLSQLFESVDIDVQVYSSAEEFLADYKQQLGCILLDVRMQGMSGLQLQKELQKRGNNLPIIFITGHGDIPMTKRAIKDGAIDFFTKPFNNQELLEVVQITLQQNVVLKKEQDRKNTIISHFNTLTAREKEIMQAVVDGNSNKKIMHEFNISISTVEAHRAKVMTKMQVDSLAELVKLSMKYNLFR